MSLTLEPLSFDKIETGLSMTMLDRFSRCRRKWKYRYRMGLVPKSMPEYVHLGSAFHAAVAGGYLGWQRQRESTLFLANALGGLDTWLSEHPTLLSTEHVALVQDMVQYWWEHEGSEIEQDYSEIVSVEEPLPLNISYYPAGSNEEKIIPMRCTPDLLARRRDTGRLTLTDHKTVGMIGDSLNFLTLDFQLRAYATSVWRKYGEAPEVDYNLVRRELPPDFTRADGSKPYGLTKTGRPSTRSKDPDDYVRRIRQVFTPKMLEASEVDISEMVSDMAQAWAQSRYPRSRIKAGASACANCEYFFPCQRELDGEKLDSLTISLAYDREIGELVEKRAA